MSARPHLFRIFRMSNNHSPDVAALRDALREVLDPEVGVNVVDLGLVYGVAADENGTRVDLTMTTPACPLGETLISDTKAALRRSGAPEPIAVELVWDPPWSPARMTPAAKRQLGWTDA
jgi:metal-sulfur cluster biosynthetic enzyme